MVALWGRQATQTRLELTPLPRPGSLPSESGPEAPSLVSAWSSAVSFWFLVAEGGLATGSSHLPGQTGRSCEDKRPSPRSRTPGLSTAGVGTRAQPLS